MPTQSSPAFSMTSTFIPAGGARNVLTGFLAVDGDAGSTPGVRSPGYGTMRLLQLPRDTVVPGPGQVQNNFNANTSVSQKLNLLRQGATRVETGNLLTLPLGGGLLYVQPVYVRGSGDNSYPLLQEVLVAFGDQIGFADNLDDALNAVFQGNSGVAPTPSPAAGNRRRPRPMPPPSRRCSRRWRTRTRPCRPGRPRCKAGDFAAYGQAQTHLTDAIRRAMIAETELSGTPAATPTASAGAATSGTAG